jgi:hypothetical protein
VIEALELMLAREGVRVDQLGNIRAELYESRRSRLPAAAVMAFAQM